MRILRRTLIVALCGALALLWYWNSAYTDRIIGRASYGDGRETITLLSRSHTIDRIYQSMQGPFSNHARIALSDVDPPELIWVTGIRNTLVARDGNTPVSPEFFCHSNLTMSPQNRPREHDELTRTSSQDSRLFTLIPGRTRIALPEGFGLPLWSDELVDHYSMSLNLNEETGSRMIRFRTEIDYVRDDARRAAQATAKDIKPLFRRAIYGYEPIDATADTTCHSATHPGAACGPFVGKAASNSFVASLGNTNTIHWLIPPGSYESRVSVNVQLDLPYDTSVHYVTAHLHPFGQSIALFDKTEGRIVFQIHSRDYPDRLGVLEMQELSLPAGVPLYKDHEYELITRYVNPTAEPIDAMSILYLYALDKSFRHPAALEASN